MGNVDNIGSITEQIGPNESYTNWHFYQIGTHQIGPKIKYYDPIGPQKKPWLYLLEDKIPSSNWPREIIVLSKRLCETKGKYHKSFMLLNRRYGLTLYMIQ